MLSHNSSHIQFITYTQFQSQFHDLNITIYHAHVVNLVQNRNNLYKNISHDMGSKATQTICMYKTKVNQHETNVSPLVKQK